MTTKLDETVRAIKRSEQRKKNEIPEKGDNFVLLGWGGVLGTELVLREKK